MHDFVFFTCHNCGSTVEQRMYQGVGAGCRYHITHLPKLIDEYFHNTMFQCENCSAKHRIKLIPTKSITLLED